MARSTVRLGRMTRSDPICCYAGPDPLSYSVVRSVQLPRETSEADQWNRFWNFIGLLHKFPVATDRSDRTTGSEMDRSFDSEPMTSCIE